jgi:hypothetical protein
MTAPAIDVQQSPIYWMYQLEAARGRADAEGMRRAQEGLARLGIRVVYGRPKRQQRRLQEVPNRAS